MQIERVFWFHSKLSAQRSSGLSSISRRTRVEDRHSPTKNRWLVKLPLFIKEWKSTPKPDGKRTKTSFCESSLRRDMQILRWYRAVLSKIYVLLETVSFRSFILNKNLSNSSRKLHGLPFARFNGLMGLVLLRHSVSTRTTRYNNLKRILGLRHDLMQVVLLRRNRRFEWKCYGLIKWEEVYGFDTTLLCGGMIRKPRSKYIEIGFYSGKKNGCKLNGLLQTKCADEIRKNNYYEYTINK